MDPLNLEYLDAMGIDVYRVRDPRESEAPSDPLLETGDGDGDILCIVETKDQARLKLAAGIGAAMRCAPVWSWPLDGVADSGQAQTVRNTIAEKLITRVLVFGESLAGQVFGEDVPAVISAARIHVAPGLSQVAEDQQAKRLLWKTMLDHGIAAPRDNQDPPAGSGGAQDE